MKQNTAILDIGSSKVICLICSAQGRDSITVRGAGVKEYPGFENGRFIDEQLFSSAVVDAIAMAEGEAKVRIRDLSVGVPASFSKLVLHEGSAGVKSRTGRINGDTIDDLINDSLTFEQPEGYELMHSTPVEFKIGEGDTVYEGMPIATVYKWGYTDDMAQSLLSTETEIYNAQKTTRSYPALSCKSSRSAPPYAQP